MSSKLIACKGIADIFVALALTVKPSIIYESAITRAIASFTGLHLSSAEVAPGFNQAIACMVAAVGVGHVVSSRYGPTARMPIFVMNLTWSILSFVTCATPREWELGSATQLMSALNHAVFSLTLYLTDSELRSKAKQH